MNDISVTNLGKAYRQYSNIWMRLFELISPFEKKVKNQIWVLKNVNFKVNSGEAVGIIGMNGAGKSTLLKLIAGTSKPTEGQISINGRVAALLELGMGFHPDFTGLENIFLSAQLMGISKKEIVKVLPDILEFSEIGDYINQPVRIYSSGMQVRLAFSVATAIRPDILIVDEALSVGDQYFQHKSFDRIRKFREAGTTLLLVSHDKQAIINICDRALLLAGGSIVNQGKPESVMDFYNAMLADINKINIKQTIREDKRLATSSGNGAVVIESVELLDSNGVKAAQFNVCEELLIKIKTRANKNVESLVMGYAIKDRMGQVVFGTNSWFCKKNIIDLKQNDVFEFKVKLNANFGIGTYSLSIALHESERLGTNYDWQDMILIFEVVNLTKDFFIGIAWTESTLEVIRKDNAINF